jgi:hypothetical protein
MSRELTVGRSIQVREEVVGENGQRCSVTFDRRSEAKRDQALLVEFGQF